MKQLGALIGAVALAAALSFPAFARPVAATSGFVSQWDVRQYPVEQESPDFFFGPGTHPETWVGNPTPCDWDLDDASDQVFSATLAKTSTVSASRCVMADGYDNYGGDAHRIEVYVVSTKNDLTVTLTNDQGQSWHPIVGSDGGHGYKWLVCARDHTWDGHPISDYPVVPSSNGGTGFAVTYALTITGGSHDARNTFAYLQTGSSGLYENCPAPYPDDPPS